MIFETPRLIVRHFTRADFDAFAALCADPTVMQYMGDGYVLPPESVEKWIEVCQVKYATRGYGTSAVFEKATGEFIGYCGVIRAPDSTFDEIIYALKTSVWGQGYATEVTRAMLRYVFENFNLVDEIYATIYPANTTSIKVAEKMGMQFVKTQQDPDGETLYYVIRREQVITP